MCRTIFCAPRHCAVGALLVGLAVPVGAAGADAFVGMAGWRMLETEQLDNVRGGFDIPDLGLKLSFGLQQSVLINGELVSRTVLNLQHLQESIANQVAATRASVISTTAGISAQVQAHVAEQLRAVGLQTTPVTTVSQAGASQPIQGQTASAAPPVGGSPSTVSTAMVSQPVVAAPATGTTTATTSSPVTTPSTPVVTQTNAQVVSPTPGTTSIPVAVVQNGAGNSIGATSVVGNSSSVTTVLQNTLDNQRIQVLTEVSASANSLEVLRAMNLGESIREGVISSLRR